MTDTNSSGATFAPAADTQAPAATAVTPAGAFGSTRGSGLARGKRPSGASAPTGTPAKSDYKPTAVEIITPEREYRNPFASQEPASAPAPEPAKVETPAAASAAPEPAATDQAAEEPVREPQAAAEPTAEPVAEKSEINILPPAESARPAVSWESPSVAREERPEERSDRPQRDDRPTFRADRREDRPNAQRGAEGEARREPFQREARQPRDPREPRQPRDPRESRQPRDPRDQPQFEQRPRNDTRFPEEQASPAPKGFFAWLKGLFGGKPAAEAPAAPETPGEQFGGGHRHRRRHRGGRGPGGNQGYRGDRFSPGGERPYQGGEQEHRGGDRADGGPRRRRHRGGRGRDRGGDHRSQGQQGGGAI